MSGKIKVAFVISRLGVVEALSASLLAGLARERGHEVTLVDYGRNPERARRLLADFSPALIAYSVCSNEAADYLEINRDLKRIFPFFSAFGGPHPTFTPSYVKEPDVDAICRGEGDIVFPQFLDRFGTEAMYDVPNFVFKRGENSYQENPLADLLLDLDSLPLPARDLLYAENYFMARNPIKAFMAGRGCPNSCSYCFNSRFNSMYHGKGPVMRTKSVPYLLREISDIAKKFPLRFIRFYDDIFGADPRWLEEFAEQFPKHIGVPFCCNVRPNMVTREYISLLKRAGCYSVYTAIECGDEKFRNEILCRRISDEQIFSACEELRHQGIRIVSLNMIGLPGETEEQMLKTVEINRQARVDLVDFTIFQPYPGTRAHEYCREHGYLKSDNARVESFVTESVLDIDPVFKQRIYAIHKLATILVDHPRLTRLIRFIPKTTRLNGLLKFIFRLYYAHYLHKRIYASSIPFWLSIRGAFNVLFSRSRN